LKVGEIWTYNDTGQRVEIVAIFEGYADDDVFEEHEMYTWVAIVDESPSGDPLEEWCDQERSEFVRKFTKDYNESR